MSRLVLECIHSRRMDGMDHHDDDIYDAIYSLLVALERSGARFCDCCIRGCLSHYQTRTQSATSTRYSGRIATWTTVFLHDRRTPGLFVELAHWDATGIRNALEFLALLRANGRFLATSNVGAETAAMARSSRRSGWNLDVDSYSGRTLRYLIRYIGIEWFLLEKGTANIRSSVNDDHIGCRRVGISRWRRQRPEIEQQRFVFIKKEAQKAQDRRKAGSGIDSVSGG